MNVIIRFVLGSALVLFATYSAQPQNRALEDLIEKYQPYYEARSTQMAVLVKKNGSFESAAIGIEKNPTQQIFCIGSATKTFTAVLILQEMELGNLKLTDSIGKFLNPIKNIPGNVSIEQLLRHESGLGQTVGNPDFDGYSANNDDKYRRSIYEDIKAQDTSKIGVHRYNNTNYILLGEILEKINDSPYDQILKDRIFERCEMKNTYPYVSSNIANLMHPYSMEGKDLFERINYKYFKDRAFAAGSIASTLEDMAIFYEILYGSELLLKRSSFELMTAFGTAGYGLGLMKETINGTDYIGHGGNIKGYAFRNYYDQETGDFSLICWNKRLFAFKNSIRNDLSKYLKNEPIEDFRTAITEEFSPFVGDYLLKGPELEFSITEKDGIFNLEMQDMKFPLTSLEPGVLYDGTSGINFITNKEHSDQLIFKQAGNELIAKRIDF